MPFIPDPNRLVAPRRIQLLARAYRICILTGRHLEYGPAKNAANRRKHGVDLEDAKVVLFDPRALVREDRDSEAEQGFVAVGLDALGRVLTVVYAYREPDRLRLISARPSTSRERQAYET